MSTLPFDMRNIIWYTLDDLPHVAYHIWTRKSVVSTSSSSSTQTRRETFLLMTSPPVGRQFAVPCRFPQLGSPRRQRNGACTVSARCWRKTISGAGQALTRKLLLRDVTQGVVPANAKLKALANSTERHVQRYPRFSLSRSAGSRRVAIVVGRWLQQAGSTRWFPPFLGPLPQE